MPISTSPYLKIFAGIFATIYVGMGINAMVRPESGLAIWEFPAPAVDKKLVDNLIIVYGVRDIFMGLAIYIAAFLANRKALGAMLVAASAVAFTDGAVSIAHIGGGQWNHWGYAPVMGLVGILLLGILG
jgi:hypothetical protein